MDYSNLKLIISGIYKTNDEKFLDYLNNNTFDQNIIMHLEEILDLTAFFFPNEKLIFLKMILDKVRPGIYSDLTLDKIITIANKVDAYNFNKHEILIIFEPFMGELSSSSFYQMIETFNPNKYDLLKIVKLFINKIQEFECKHIFKILIKYFNNEKNTQDYAREYYIEQLIQLVCQKVTTHYTYVTKILNLVSGHNCETITYLMLANFKEFDMDHYGFIHMLKYLTNNNCNYFARAFIKANEELGWQFEKDELYSEEKFCEKLSIYLNSQTYEDFTKVFIKNQDIINQYHPDKKDIVRPLDNIPIESSIFKPKNDFLNSLLEQNKKEGRTISSLKIYNKGHNQSIEVVYNDGHHFTYTGPI
ncbi:hypothetical protein [Saudi moumouvirus]|nr:hypothetical protein [Saudi moumouvirus]